MKKTLIIIAVSAVLFTVTALFLSGKDEKKTKTTTAPEYATYVQISPEEAKSVMDSDEGYIILDVRNPDEFEQGHIPGAILIPYTEIAEKAPYTLMDKKQTILVYCRSGRRSKIASETLASMGYTDVREFGGINDWPYEIELSNR